MVRKAVRNPERTREGLGREPLKGGGRPGGFLCAKNYGEEQENGGSRQSQRGNREEDRD